MLDMAPACDRALQQARSSRERLTQQLDLLEARLARDRVLGLVELTRAADGQQRAVRELHPGLDARGVGRARAAADHRGDTRSSGGLCDLVREIAGSIDARPSVVVDLVVVVLAVS